MMKNAVSWFEIPVSDFERAKKFYSAIYDYQMQDQMMGDQRMGFLPFDMDSGGIGGAIIKGDGYDPSQHGVKLYLNGGDDLNTVLHRVEDAGGKIILPKTLITDEIGYYAIFKDTEGNYIHLHSDN